MVAATGPRGLIDTDILIDARRGFPDGINYLTAERAAGGIAISVVSAMELVAGCRDATDLTHTQAFLATLTVIPLTAAASIQALGWMEQFALGHGLTVPDALIAATAFERTLPLCTRNTRHYQMLPGLQLVRPY